MDEYEDQGLRGGVWRGQLRRAQAPGRILLVHMGEVVCEAAVRPVSDGLWQVSAQLPVDRLTDGAATFALHEASSAEGDALRPATTSLATLPLIAGQALHRDLRAELTLLRAELDLLKREFRRHAARSGYDGEAVHPATAAEDGAQAGDSRQPEARDAEPGPEALMTAVGSDASAAHGQPPAPRAEHS